MDIRKYLTVQIKKCRNRMNLARLIDCAIVFAAAGGVLGTACELVSLVWPFYHVHLAAGLCFGLGLLAGAGCALHRRADMEQAARRLDSFGLKERIVTAYELMDKGVETRDALAEMQRQDALVHYNQARDRIKIPLRPDKRHVLALVLSVIMVAGLSLVPSPVRDQAQLRHQVQEAAKEELQQLEALADALDRVDMESLTEEQKLRMQKLQEAMRRSWEELTHSDTWESLALAQERLEYKYQQAGQSLAQLASQMQDPGAAGIASAQALAQAAGQNGGGNNLAQAAISSGQSGNGSNNGNGDGNGSNNGNGDGNGSNNGNGDGSGSNNGNGDGNGSNSGNGDGNGSNSGNGDGAGSGNGNGDGAGSGNGNGDGAGSGNGNGDGAGQGNGSGGRGTGSSNAPHDYVSIPNDIGDDPSLTGEKNGDQNSGYFRQQNGLAWEGEHVDYNSVISQYTNRAFEGITRGKYPSGMESVIRDYFENLNQ